MSCDPDRIRIKQRELLQDTATSGDILWANPTRDEDECQRIVPAVPLRPPRFSSHRSAQVHTIIGQSLPSRTRTLTGSYKRNSRYEYPVDVFEYASCRRTHFNFN